MASTVDGGRRLRRFSSSAWLETLSLAALVVGFARIVFARFVCEVNITPCKIEKEKHLLEGFQSHFYR